MLRSVKSLIGYAIGATDGEIGKVKEFYFDDKTWTIRYLIVETGNWLSGRKMLISTESLLTPDWSSQVLPVNLTMEQVKNSPGISTELPVSRQQEIKLYEYYPWGRYWDGSFGIGSPAIIAATPNPAEPTEQEKNNEADEDRDDDPHLRSTDAVKGYSINAIDGSIGSVEDYIVDDRNWEIEFIVVDTSNWFFGKKVLISPKWIKQVEWKTSSVVVNIPVEKVKNSPEYDPKQPISEAYSTSLHDFYGRPVYR